MQLRKTVKSIILPVMEREGFKLTDSATSYYEFALSDDSVRVIIDKDPWPPSELRVKFYYRNYLGGFSFLEINRLNEYINLDLQYTSQEELEQKLLTIAGILESHSIAFIKSIRDNHVYFTSSDSVLLSADPAKQALRYVKGVHLTFENSLENYLFMEGHVAEMRGEIIGNWRTNFEKHKTDIIDLISFYGEITIMKDNCGAKWEWGDSRSFGLAYEQGWRYPQSDLVNYWNYGLYMPMSRFVPYDLRQKLTNNE